ncbi:hypothetical protein [Vibrio cortegadensis]|uniref:Uncharacterized protein n=1 Tax=Vibrio cortegadensis TaxID=1328770 RepID=A0ABV4MBY2_9VIBR
MGRLSNLLTVVSVTLTVLLFTISAAHNGGYLLALQLDSDALSRNFERVIYHGFQLTLEHLIDPLGVWGLASITTIFLIRIVIDFKYRKVKSHRIKDGSILLFLNVWLKSKSKYAKSLLLLPVNLLIILGAYVGVLAFFQNQGMEKASQALHDIDSRNLFGYQFVISKDFPPTNGAGFIHLYCGSNVCVAIDLEFGLYHQYDPKGSTVILVPDQCEVTANKQFKSDS